MKTFFKELFCHHVWRQVTNIEWLKLSECMKCKKEKLTW